LEKASSFFSYTIQSKRHGIAEELFQLFRGGPYGIFQIRATFGAAEVRRKHEACAFLSGEANCRQRFADASAVGDDTVFERNVEVHADEDAFAAEVEIVDGELVHDVSFQSLVVSFRSEKKTSQKTYSALVLSSCELWTGP
jgi:hypothetical protein